MQHGDEGRPRLCLRRERGEPECLGGHEREAAMHGAPDRLRKTRGNHYAMMLGVVFLFAGAFNLAVGAVDVGAVFALAGALLALFRTGVTIDRVSRTVSHG